MRRNPRAKQAAAENYRAKFVKDGAIDHEAIKEFAAKEAAKMWKEGDWMFKTAEEMAEGFYNGIIRDINS